MFCSIIVPIYNVERYLSKCIDTLLDQDIQDYEIILIDDKSVDNSLKIAEEYERKHERIKLIKKERNTGLSDTRNEGLRIAQGEYILFVDSDDCIEKNILRTIKEEIVNSNADIVYLGFECINDDTTEIQYTYISKPGVYSKDDFMLNELRHGNLSIPACMACYRKDLIEENNLYFETGILHEDVRWSPVVLNAASTVLASKIVFYKYLIRESSISHQKKDRTKNGMDLMNTCLFLRDYSSSIDNNKIRRFFLNYVATGYLKAVAVNEVAFKNPESIDRSFPVKLACRPKDIIRSIIFMVNPRIYSIVYKYVKEKLQNEIV